MKLLSAALACLAFGQFIPAAHAAGLFDQRVTQATPSQPSPDLAAQGRAYFMQHSFDFPTVFRSHHPGPAWILQHASDFNLTPQQTAAMERLRDGMRSSVAEDSAKLKQAYSRYETDSRATAPHEKAMLDDVHAVGDAQTQLAGAMIPYHLQAFEQLNAEQRQIYERLVAAAQ